MKKLFIVADWAFDSLTQAEVKIAIEGFLKQSQNANISFIAATPSTIHTGFLISQLVEDIERYGQPLESVIFQNTDPRLHTKRGLPVIMKLKSGLYLIGPNSGYDFSLIKNRIDELFIYKGLNDKGQFHSRDLYSRISAHLMDYLEDELELEEVNVDNIPDLKGFFVGHIDNFGNMKTTITQEDFKGKYEYDDFVNVKINGKVKKARYVSNLFGGTPGELVIYPGSSGKMNNRYLELSIWRHFTEVAPTTGAAEFDFPKVGSEIQILTF